MRVYKSAMAPSESVML